MRGKITTVYACLREIIAQSRGARCIMMLEDLIEVAVDGADAVSGSAHSRFRLATGSAR
ncbi:MAG: hypothetical protein U0936_18340 [Planctomycetaceae bacterium]